MEMSAWDHALADQTNKLVDQLLAAGEETVPRQSLLPIMQRLRRFVQDTAGRREASPVLATTLQLVLNPCLGKFYPQDGDDAITQELLETLYALGQGCPKVVELMQQVRTFETLAWMVMKPSISKAAANCLGRLANSPGQAGIAAQLAILQGGIAMEGPPAPPDPSQPESSAAAAARDQSEGSPLPLLYKLLVTDDAQARIAAVNMLQALVNNVGEGQLQQQQAIALYGNGAILLFLATKVQQLCVVPLSHQDRQELRHMLHLLISVAGDCKPAQDKLARMGLLESMLGFICNHQATMPKLQLKQSLAVLIALLHCHVANQALLLPHARTLVEALAAMLQALALERTHDTSQGAKNTGAAAEDQLAPSLQFTEAAELLAKRPTQPQRSALSAELEGQAAADHSSVSKIDNVGSSTSALTSSLRQAQMQQSASPQHAVQQSAAEDQTAGSPSGAQQDLTMVSELKQACYSLLLFLPAAELQGREQFWMQHAAGLPFLLRCCLAAAITFEPRAVQSLYAMLHDWGSAPGAAAMLRPLAYHRCILEGLVQASQGEAGTEATLALGLLLKQGNDVGSFLLATDAAEGLAKATLEMETTVLFDTHRELSELIVSMIPNKATAANIVRMCQAAILESSSLVRNRAMDIMRTIARLAFDSHDRAIHAGQAQNAGQTRQAQNAGQTRQAQNAGQTRQAQQTQQAAAATPEAEDSVPRQQMQETVDVAAGLARLLQSTAESQPSTPVGSMTDTGTGSAAEVGPGLPSDAVAAVQQLGETASSDLSQIAASPITDRSGNAASAAQQAAAALTERQQLADRATDELSAAIGSTPTATDASFSPGQDAAASVTTPTATDASSSPGQVAAAIGSTPTTADASFSLGQDAAASVTTALATDVPSSPGQDAAASVTTPTATNASPSPVQDAAAALAQRQQVAQQAIDDLFAEVDSSQAGDAGSAILAAAAGQSPLAAALRQHIVDQAMQELFGTDRSSSPRCGLSGSQALPAAADASAAAERYAAIHPALTATAAAATPSLAAARTAATPTGPALQRQPTAEQTGFQIRAFEGEEEVHLGGSYSSADSVASRQDALDQAIDELIFPDRTSSDSADSDGSQTGSLHSSSGSSHAAEGSTSESSSASSSSGEDSEQSGSEPAEYDRSVEETAATSAGHSRVRLHAPESLTAILRALQQRADTSASRSQAQGVPAAVQGASATAAPAVAAERNIRQPQSAAPNRPVRQRQGILGLPSLRLMPSTRTGQAPSVNSPAAAASSVAAVASPQHLGDAEMQRECRDMVRRMTEAVQDNDYHEGQNFLDFMPGITAEEAASHESIEDYIWRQDQTPRCLIAAENDREGSQWKTKVPGFYAVNSEYRRGHVMDVREQIFCRRQVGFHVKVGRKKRLRQVFRGVLGVAAAALAAGLVTKRVHWHGKDDSRVEVDETETESGTDSDDESEVIRLLWASDLTAQPQFI